MNLKTAFLQNPLRAVSRLATRHTLLTTAVMLGVSLLASVPDDALAQANGNGYLVLCPGSGPIGTSIGYQGSLTSLNCGIVDYSFALGNTSNANGTGAGAATSLVKGYQDGRLLLQGDGGITVRGASSFTSSANFNGNRITGLAAGTAGTDAVNLAQMNAALAAQDGNPLIKVNGTIPADAQGSKAIAIGDSARVSTSGGATGGIAIGAGANANAGADLAFGAGASANAVGAPGNGAADYSAALGMGASVMGGRSVAVGNGAKVTAASAATDMRGTAVGNAAEVTGTGAVALGQGARASATNAVALGQGAVGDRANSVSIGNASQKRQLINVAAGTADTDAVNLRQLNDAMAGTGSNFVKVGGGQAGIAADNAGRAGNIAIGGNAHSNAPSSNSASIALGEDALSNGAGSVAVGTTSTATGSGAVALGLRSAATAAGAVAIGSDSLADRANAVSIGKTGLLRQLSHLAAGTDDTDAANMAQLKKNAATTAAALGGAAAMAADGSVVAPRYVLDGGTYNNVGDALGNLDGRVSTNRQSIIDLGKVVEDLSQGDFGLVSYDDVRGSVDVAAGKGGSQVDVGGTDGARRLAGVANATNDDEAVTLAQLRAAGALDPTSGTFLSVLTYDDASLGKATLGGTAGTVIDNLRNGQVAAGSMQAINGGQLFQSLTDAASILGGGASVGLQGAFVAPNYVIQGTTYTNVGSALAALDGKVSDIDQRLTGQGAIRTAGAGRNAPVAGAVAQQAQAKTDVGTPAAATTAAATGTAVGAGAVASGVGATAIGEGAVASADNAVALGQGSVADRAGTVSVGSIGNERQIANVAEGTEATDAVNKAQLDRGVASANTYTDTKFQGLSDSFDVFKGEVDQRLHTMDRRIDRQGAMSSAMLNMATSAAGVRTDNRVGVGVGFQGGQSALSIGYQRAISERATVTLGGALSGDDASVGFGAGFGW